MELLLDSRLYRNIILGIFLSLSVLGLVACYPIRPGIGVEYRYPGPYYGDYPYYYDYAPYYYPGFYGLSYWGNYYYPGYHYRGYPYYYPSRPGRGGRAIRHGTRTIR